MATLDFSELDKRPPGEPFQALVRMLGERLGLIVQWAGRGPDGGKDLLFLETQEGPLASKQTKWLVSCKDNSESGSSVTEKDLGSVIDKVDQHKCDGFLLATTTTASTGLKEKLDKLDVTNGGRILTKVWDRFEITKLLLNENFADIFNQYFPKQFSKPRSLDEARRTVESALPRFVAGTIRRYLVSHGDRVSALSGKSVWPHDADQAAIIDEAHDDVLYIHRHREAADKLCELNFEPFLAFVDALIKNFPQIARSLLRNIVEVSNDNSILYNSFEILREDDNFTFEEELELAKRYDSELLSDLYRDIVLDSISDLPPWEARLPSSAANYDDNVELERVEIDDLEFGGGDAVSFFGTVHLTVRGWSNDPDRLESGREQFSYRFSGFLSSDGVDLEDVR
jgi:hypothetical protein